MPVNLENSAVATELEKVSFHSNPKERQCQKNVQTAAHALISHAGKVMLKFSKLGFDSMWTENFQMLNVDLEKAEEPEVKLQTSIGS